MVSIIKNQILKHLSKFTKNLTPDQMNLSTFKGEGELRNLELNEEVLMDLLELPNWLRLTKAICNKVSIKVQWTKLKSVPIFLNLDEVLVEVETCEELRQMSSQNTRQGNSSASKYGFPDMVIDGMTVSINNVEINFRSPAFHASFQLSRVKLESRSPSWHQSDLRMTRLKDPDNGQLLIFKELEWQMLRIEASATDRSSEFTSPLRLITNQARCRITIKKRLIDCGILASRLFLIVDDLLWILTDTQIQAALHFVSSLSGLIRKSSEMNKRVKAAHKIEFISMANQSHMSQYPGQTQSDLPRAFSMFDMVETSFHIYSSRIDLHFCDEASPGEGRSNHALLVDGGAMQVTLTGMAFDYYPYHLASGGRKHWMRYGDLNTSCEEWMEQLMAAYRHQLLDIVLGEIPKKHIIHQHSTSSVPLSFSHEERRRSSGQNKAATVTIFLRRLMATCFILRLDDFSVFQVSTSATKKKVPEKFFASDKNRLMLPTNLPSVHLEFIDYYFPGDDDFPVPLANLHIHLNPIQLNIDPVTFLWLNAFSSGLQKSQQCYQSAVEDSRPFDIRVEALMPRIIVQESKEHQNQPSRPRSVQLHISRLIATNSRIGDNCDRSNLQQSLVVFQEGSLFSLAGFPNKEDDVDPLSSGFSLHATYDDDVVSTRCNKNIPIPRASSFPESVHGTRSVMEPSPLSRDMLWTENKSMWCVHLEPVWVDFCVCDGNKSRPTPFIDAVQVTLWIHRNSVQTNSIASSPSKSSSAITNETAGSVHVLAQFKSLVSVQLNHYQFVFMLRITELLTELATNLAIDSETESHSDNVNYTKATTSKLCLAAILPEVDVSFLIPVNLPKCGSDAITEIESMRDDLSSSTANTGVGSMDRVGSTGDLLMRGEISTPGTRRLKMRESVSDNQISQKLLSAGDRILDTSITSSCSDYTLGRQNISNHGMLNSDSKSETNSGTNQLLAVTPTHKHLSFRRLADVTEPKSISVSTGSKESLRLRNESIQSLPIEAISIPTANTSIANVDRSIISNSRTSTQGNSQMQQTFGAFFGQQQNSMSIDSFTTPFLERTSLEKMPDHFGKTIATGSSVVKKGFSSLVASLDSALLNPNKTPTTPATSPLSFYDSYTLSSSSANSRIAEDAETISLCSDLSDSDNFIFLNSDGIFSDENMFSTNSTPADVAASVEVASEVKEDSSSDKSSSNSFRRQDVMKIVIFKLGTVEVIHESQGLDAISKLQVHYLSSEDGGTMTWEEFQAKFSSSSRTWKEEAIKYTLPTCDVKVRFQRGPQIQHVCTEAVDRGFLEARLSDITLDLMTSSISNLKDLLDDEITPIAIPMNMVLSKFHLHIQEDRNSLDVTTADSVPTVFDVQELVISRTPDGIFHIIPGDMAACDSPVFELKEQAIQVERTRSCSRRHSSDSVSETRIWARRSSLEDLEEKVFHLEEENEQLRLKLIAMETIKQDECDRNMVEQDVSLKESVKLLKEVQDEVCSLKEEKKSLMATLQLLQDELLISEKRASTKASNRRAAR